MTQEAGCALVIIDAVFLDLIHLLKRAGNACRLAFDLGLHHDWSSLSASTLSALDMEARQVVFWGCFAFDRYTSNNMASS